MRAIVTFFDHAKKAIIESSGEMKITMNIIINQMKPVMIKLTKLKFEVSKFDFVFKIYRILNNLSKRLPKLLKNFVKKSSLDLEI